MAQANQIEKKAEALAEKTLAGMVTLLQGRTDVTTDTDYEATPLSIYDVEYVRQGKEYFLNVYIDKEGGVNIGDCEAFSRILSDALDAEDFISDQYTLIVSSPGLGRKLVKDRHFAKSLGEEVELKTFAPDAAGRKEFEGVLKAADDGVVIIQTEEGDITVNRKDIALCRLKLDF